MNTTVALIAPLIATLGTAVVLGGVRWLRAVTNAVGKLTDVAATLSDVTGDVAQLREDLAAHVRECRHHAARDRPPDYAGPERRHLPRPRPVPAAGAEA